MDKELTEAIEIQLFLDTVKQYYGYDFSQYSPASLHRRIKDLVRKNKLSYISELIPFILYKQGFIEALIAQIYVGVTGFFRDPGVYKQLTNQVVAKLRSYPGIKVWSAGCAIGQEAYSLAILFKEAGLLDKTRIVATDIRQEAVDTAKKGIYPDSHIRQYSSNYQHAGGATSFSDYFTSRYELIKIKDEIMNCVSFKQHDLVKDDAFSEIQLIVCRNVLIYFNEALQARLLKLFSDALSEHGFLFLGPKDCLHSPVLEAVFEVVDEKSRIYRKK